MKEVTCVFIKEAIGRTLIRIAIADIMYLESMGNYVKIVYNTDSYSLIHRSLRKLLQVLPPTKFCRIHQSHVVHIDHIHHVNGNIVSLQNGVELKIGTNFRKDFMERLLGKG